MSFLTTDAVHQKDFQGDSVGESCVVTPGTQRATRLLIEEALSVIDEAGARKPVGIVIPVQDLWGMSADDGIITLTCFCVHCVRALEAHGVDLASFRGHPNPWNLLLQDSVTGVAPIDTFCKTTTAEELVAISCEKKFHAYEALETARQRGTDEEEKRRYENETRDALLESAAALKTYMDAIGQVTKEAILRICSCPREHGLRCALIGGSSPYEWSTRMFFDDLNDPDFVDEIWLEPSNEYTPLDRVPSRGYLFMRGRYNLDALFEVVDLISGHDRSRVLLDLSRDRLRKQFLRRSDAAIERVYRSRLDVEAVPDGENSAGYVIPAFDAGIVEAIAVKLFGEDWRAASDDEGAVVASTLSGLEALLQKAEKLES